MNQLLSFLTSYWFSLSLLSIVSLSLVKQLDLPETKSLFSNNNISITKAKTTISTSQLNNTSAPQQPVLVSKTKLVESGLNIEKQDHKKFIHRFSKVAVNEMEKYGIPASITLAHAILESDGITGVQNRENNFFNTPCANNDCSHKTAWLSFRAHSIHLTTGAYKYLPRTPISNLTEWAKGIQSIGYANQPTYDEQLLDIIDLYQLNRFDEMGKKV